FLEQSRVERAINTQYRVPLDVLHRSEIPEPVETPVAGSAEEDGAEGSPSCPVQSDQQQLSPGELSHLNK
ncbi:hypothetical protein BGZ96_002356, partial [Linnemannia gamsii]